eukprot:8915872-Pyramimonas_sp.AAC.1
MRCADKPTPASTRWAKMRAASAEARQLREWAKATGFPLPAASWAIPGQFCFRFAELGSEAVTLSFSL